MVRVWVCAFGIAFTLWCAWLLIIQLFNASDHHRSVQSKPMGDFSSLLLLMPPAIVCFCRCCCLFGCKYRASAQHIAHSPHFSFVLSSLTLFLPHIYFTHSFSSWGGCIACIERISTFIYCICILTKGKALKLGVCVQWFKHKCAKLIYRKRNGFFLLVRKKSFVEM